MAWPRRSTVSTSTVDALCPPAIRKLSRKPPPMTQTYILPDRLDTTAANGLAEALRARMHAPIIVDGAAVEKIGALALQVLVAAARDWREDTIDFTLDRPSDALLSTCRTLGIAPADIGCPKVE